MSLPIDPILRLRRSRITVDSIGGLAIVSSVVWTVWPLNQAQLTPTTYEQKALPSSDTLSAPNSLSLEPFDAILWHEPPAPVSQPVVRPPPAPRLQLVAISAFGKGYQAVIQDIDAGELRTVRTGDEFGVTTVISVEHDAVRLEAHERLFELSLDGRSP